MNRNNLDQDTNKPLVANLLNISHHNQLRYISVGFIQ
jgi:hypothetical protein